MLFCTRYTTPYLINSQNKINSQNSPINLMLLSFFTSLLNTPIQISHLFQIHASIITFGIKSDQIYSKLLQNLFRFNHITHAHNLFDQIPQPTTFLYNNIIKLQSNHNLFNQVLNFCSKMIKYNVAIDGFTLPPVLKACACLKNVIFGSLIHSRIIQFGFEHDIFVQNGLISMYTKCGEIRLANDVFDRIVNKNLISWTSILSGFVQNGYPLKAIRIFRSMMKITDIKPDFVTLVSVLKAFSDIEDLKHGMCVHGLDLKLGLNYEADIIITLCAMYANCGEVVIARVLFDTMKEPNLILWNSMISGYAKNGYPDKAIELFKKMVDKNINTDSITIRSSTSACAQLGSLETGKWIENYIIKSEYKGDIFVNTTLIDMYAKCGSIANAHRVFITINDKDVVAWSAIIMSYGLHGHAKEAIKLYNNMIDEGIKPNEITFIGLLSACNHAGLVDEGWVYFHSMKNYNIVPCHQHYACVLDLVARAGLLQKAFEFIMEMPIEPEVSVWGALLNACNIHSNVSLGEIAAYKVFELDPKNAGHYVQLSNIYASNGMWKGVAKVRVLMKERGVMKEIGNSFIEINGELHAFRVEDKYHRKSREIFALIDGLEKMMNEVELIPRIDSICLA